MTSSLFIHVRIACLAILMEKCLNLYAEIDESQFKSLMVEATKKLKPYPGLLVEMVLRYRAAVGCSLQVVP